MFAFGFWLSTLALADHIRLGTPVVEPYHNEQMTGIIDQVLLEVFDRVGHAVVIEVVPAERSLISASSGVLDGDAFRAGGLSQTYPKLVQSSEPIFYVDFVVFTTRNKYDQVMSDGLDGLRIGIVRGYKIIEDHTRDMAYVRSVNNPQDLFKQLAIGGFDAVIINQQTGENEVVSQNLKNIEMVLPPIIRRPMYLYLNKKHIDLMQQVDRALRDMHADGTISRILSN